MLPNVRTILYCTDLGRFTRPAFRLAVSIASQYNARVVFLHVIEPLGANARHLVDMYLPEGSVEEMRRKGIADLKQRVHERIQKFIQEEMPEGMAFPGGDPEARVEQGDPAVTVLKMADEIDADLVVMGSHSHSTLGEFLLGSVAHKVTHHSKRPVLLVPLKE